MGGNVIVSFPLTFYFIFYFVVRLPCDALDRKEIEVGRQCYRIDWSLGSNSVLNSPSGSHRRHQTDRHGIGYTRIRQYQSDYGLPEKEP